MEIVIDSHALFWFFSDSPKLSPQAKEIITSAKSVIIPSIVLLEILYLLEKMDASQRFPEFLELNQEKYLIYPLDFEVVKKCAAIKNISEMHDRIIVATASLFDIPIVTQDEEIIQEYSKVYS